MSARATFGTPAMDRVISAAVRARARVKFFIEVCPRTYLTSRMMRHTSACVALTHVNGPGVAAGSDACSRWLVWRWPAMTGEYGLIPGTERPRGALGVRKT